MSLNWDQHYLDQHTPWDKGAPAPPLLEWIEANPEMMRGRVLVPGCGLGHDVRAIARLCGVDAVVGLDLSPKAVDLAGQFPVEGTESYETGDLFALDPHHQAAYDWIWEHTCYCAIDPGLRDAYVEAVFHALKPGGHFLGVFYLNPYDDEHPPGGGPPHGATVEELEERFLSSGRFVLEDDYIPGQAYAGREGLERVVRMGKCEADPRVPGS